MNVTYYDQETNRIRTEPVDCMAIVNPEEVLKGLLNLLGDKGLITEQEVRDLLRLENP